MLKHLSVSSITSWQQCPRKWRLHYIDQLITPTSANLLFGTAFHATVETYVSGLALDEERGTLLECWENAFNETFDKAEQGSGVAWGNETRQSLFNDGRTLVTTTATARTIAELVPALDVHGRPMVERYFEVMVPGVGVPLIGYVDLILPPRESGGPLRLVDLKTASRNWAAGKADASPQGILYTWAMRQLGMTVEDEFSYYVFNRNKPTAPSQEIARVTPERIAWHLRALREVWTGIRAGVFPPGSDMGWWCTSGMCEHWEACHAVADDPTQ